jgi:hypothetical protein
MKVGEQTFSFQIASSVGGPDGLGVEVYRGASGDSSRTFVCEIFRDDVNRKVSFSAFEKEIPFEVVEHACRMARERLADWRWPEE